MKESLNLIICTWHHPRPTEGPHPFPVPQYLEMQVESLSKLPHELDQITFVSVAKEQQPPVFRDYLYTIPEILDANVVIHETCNHDLSYGAFDRTVEVFPQFTHYILLEDDYLFVQPYFDHIMLRLMKKQECDYLCTLCFYNGETSGIQGPFAAISNGMVTKMAWEKKFAYQCLPGHVRMGHSQIEWSTAFTKSGLRLGDITSEFRTPFWSVGTTWYNENAPTELIVPAQVYAAPEMYRPETINWPKWRPYGK
jgi:hypothetical protein